MRTICYHLCCTVIVEVDGKRVEFPSPSSSSSFSPSSPSSSAAVSDNTPLACSSSSLSSCSPPVSPLLLTSLEADPMAVKLPPSPSSPRHPCLLLQKQHRTISGEGSRLAREGVHCCHWRYHRPTLGRLRRLPVMRLSLPKFQRVSATHHKPNQHNQRNQRDPMSVSVALFCSWHRTMRVCC